MLNSRLAWWSWIYADICPCALEILWDGDVLEIVGVSDGSSSPGWFLPRADCWSVPKWDVWSFIWPVQPTSSMQCAVSWWHQRSSTVYRNLPTLSETIHALMNVYFIYTRNQKKQESYTVFGANVKECTRAVRSNGMRNYLLGKHLRIGNLSHAVFWYVLGRKDSTRCANKLWWKRPHWAVQLHTWLLQSFTVNFMTWPLLAMLWTNSPFLLIVCTGVNNVLEPVKKVILDYTWYHVLFYIRSQCAIEFINVDVDNDQSVVHHNTVLFPHNFCSVSRGSTQNHQYCIECLAGNQSSNLPVHTPGVIRKKDKSWLLTVSLLMFALFIHGLSCSVPNHQNDIEFHPWAGH